MAGVAMTDRERIESHSNYFDRLVNLVPESHYIPREVEWVDNRFAKHKKKKARTVDPIKKRSRFDPAKAEKSVAEAAGKKFEEEKNAPLEVLRNGKKKSIEDLQRKLLEKKKNRPALGKRPLPEVDPANGGSSSSSSDGKNNNSSSNNSKNNEGANGTGDGPAAKKAKKDQLSLMYSQFDLSSGAATPLKKGKSKKALLREAEAQQKKMETLKATPEGRELAKDIAFRNAEAKARGIKIKDNPTLLKKAIKREEKKKERSAKQWAERTEAVEKAKELRQKKRTENIKAKKQGRLDRKMGVKVASKISKVNGKKRAGFEGKNKKKKSK